MTAITLPQASVRRLHIDGRLVTGIVLMAVSVVGGVRLAAAADHTVPVVVAARDLAAGHVIAAGDLTVTRIHADRGLLASMVRGADAGTLRGRVLLAPVERHAAVPRRSIATSPRAGREITVPVTPEHALGGAIRVGEHVDVFATFDKNQATARTVTVVRDAEVVAVHRTRGVFGQSGASISAISLTVPPDDAVFLAFAMRTGELDVVRSNGGAPSGRDAFQLEDLEP